MGRLVPACLALLAASCTLTPVECDQDCQDNWMDGDVNDSSFDGTDSYHYYRVSKRPDSLPAEVKRTIPVILAVHGFSASTYEWLELRRHVGDTMPYAARAAADDTPKVLVSLVLLGGHGQDWRDFQDSSWEAWGRPILEEYDSLVKQGYGNISIAGASTGCPLILEHVARGRFREHPPRSLLFIDPIISPSSKILSLIGILGPIVGNSPSDNTAEEEKHWYTNRPQESLNELYTLVNRIKNRLEDGITLPPGTRAKVWKAERDGLADPIGALMLYKGLKNSDGSRIDVEMVKTGMHVFTRLDGREGIEPGGPERELQESTFKEMLEWAGVPE